MGNSEKNIVEQASDMGSQHHIKIKSKSTLTKPAQKSGNAVPKGKVMEFRVSINSRRLSKLKGLNPDHKITVAAPFQCLSTNLRPPIEEQNQTSTERKQQARPIVLPEVGESPHDTQNTIQEQRVRSPQAPGSKRRPFRPSHMR